MKRGRVEEMANGVLTDITVVLDRSGSMESMRQGAIDGYNSFIAEQKKLPYGAVLTLVQFDHEYEVVFSARDIREVPPLTVDTYAPRGGTALRDAMVRAVAEAEKRLNGYQVPVIGENRTEREERQMIFVVITDGEDTSSKEVSPTAVADAMKGAKSRGWEVVLIGANMDAIAAGKDFGVRSTGYQQGNIGGALRAASAYVGSSRMVKNSADKGLVMRALAVNEAVLASADVADAEATAGVIAYADLLRSQTPPGDEGA